MWEYAGIGLVALNMAIAEGAKLLGFNNKIAGIIAVLMGVLEGVLLYNNGNILEALIIGLAIGLSSVGLYSTSKNTSEFLRGDE